MRMLTATELELHAATAARDLLVIRNHSDMFDTFEASKMASRIHFRLSQRARLARRAVVLESLRECRRAIMPGMDENGYPV